MALRQSDHNAPGGAVTTRDCQIVSVNFPGLSPTLEARSGAMIQPRASDSSKSVRHWQRQPGSLAGRRQESEGS
eukprot:353277-Hanusia_phi.AAC.1